MTELSDLQARVTLLEAQVIRANGAMIAISGITLALSVCVILVVIGAL